MKRTIFQLLVLVFTVVLVSAQEKAGNSAMPSMGVAIFRMVGSLAIVIALFRHRESLNPDTFMNLKW